MLTFNQTPKEDNEIIWFFKILLDSETVKLCDRVNGITLDSTEFWDGASLSQESNFNQMDKSIDIANGGSLPNVSEITLEICRNNDNSFFSDFINAYYPNTSEYLDGRIVHLGIGWEGITSENDITWVEEFYIDSNNSDYTRISLSLYTFDDFDIQLPKHIIQNEDPKANYYFPYADEDNLGNPLPILYGDFQNDVYLAPTICVDEQLKEYFVSSESLQILVSGLYTYFEKCEKYMYLDNPSYSSILKSTNFYNSVSLFSGYDLSGDYIRGTVNFDKFNETRINKVISGPISNAVTSGTNVLITCNKAHKLRIGEIVDISGVIGMTDLNNRFEINSVISGFIFSVSLTTAQTYISGGEFLRLNITFPYGTYLDLTLNSDITDSDFGEVTNIEAYSEVTTYDGSEKVSYGRVNTGLSGYLTATATYPNFETQNPFSYSSYPLENIINNGLKIGNIEIGNFTFYLQNFYLTITCKYYKIPTASNYEKTRNTRMNDGSKNTDRWRRV